MSPARQPRKHLLAALRHDDADQFRRILDNEGWPATSEFSDYELLLKAVRRGCKRVAWLLLEKGARIAKKKRVNSPLHEAASRLGWTDFVVALLARGARVADTNNKGDTALHIAFDQHKSIELIDLLLKNHLQLDGSDGDIVNRDGLSFLHVACSRPHLSFVKALVEDAKVDVDVQVPVISNSAYAGYTPLHFAVAFNQYSVAEHLLSHYNADMYEQDANGSTPLHLATERGNVRMIDLLLRYDEHREDCHNSFGLSHFMAACAGSDESVVEEYLRVAAYRSWTEPDSLVRSQVKRQPNYPNAGYSPLHFAAEYGRVATAKILLQLGARCCSTALDSVTPVALAFKRDHVDVCQLLTDCCAAVCPANKRLRRDDCGADASCVNFAFEFVDFQDSSRKRKMVRSSGSTGSDGSTLAASSCGGVFCFSDSELNPRQISQHQINDANSYYWNCVFHSPGVVRDDSSCNRLISNNEEAWNVKLDSAMDYPAIDIPKDCELDFYEPLDDVDIDDSFGALNVTCAGKQPASVKEPSDLHVNSEMPEKSSSVDLAADDVKSVESSDKQLFDELFDKCLKESNSFEDQDDSSIAVDVKSSIVVNEERKFDELMLRFLKDASREASSPGDDSDTKFATFSIVNASPARGFVRLPSIDDLSANDDLDTTLEITSSSSESDILEDEARLSIISDGSSTECVSSGYDTDASIDSFIRENNCPAHESSRISSPEREVEVVFVEVEVHNEQQASDAILPEESAMDADDQKDVASESTDSGVQCQSGDASVLTFESPSSANRHVPFRFSVASEQRFDFRSERTLDFTKY